MTSHKDHKLDLLGINSQYEADELEHELDIRFDRFSYHGREAWVQQNAYLDAYANTRAVSDAADTAGVTVPTAQAWKFLNTLGFKRRLEIADLRFSDSLQVMALERAREPDAPASLLIALLRAHIPEKFSSNGHTCDTSKADELLFLYSQDAKRELDAGHPTFRAIANGTYQPPNRHTGGGGNPEAAHSNLSPAGEDTPRSNLSPAGGEIQRGGSFPENQYDSEETTPHDDIHPVDPDEVARANPSPTTEEHTSSPSAPSAPSAVNPSPTPQNPAPSTQNPSAPSAVKPTRRPIASIFQTRRRPQHDDPNTFKVTRF